MWKTFRLSNSKNKRRERKQTMKGYTLDDSSFVCLYIFFAFLYYFALFPLMRWIKFKRIFMFLSFHNLHIGIIIIIVIIIICIDICEYISKFMFELNRLDAIKHAHACLPTSSPSLSASSSSSSHYYLLFVIKKFNPDKKNYSKNICSVLFELT